MTATPPSSLRISLTIPNYRYRTGTPERYPLGMEPA
ncbi:hypothetical protein ACVWY0_001197 [Arthrobacter sp. UYNi723]